jgi:hypothetical protein
MHAVQQCRQVRLHHPAVQGWHGVGMSVSFANWQVLGLPAYDFARMLEVM